MLLPVFTTISVAANQPILRISPAHHIAMRPTAAMHEPKRIYGRRRPRRDRQRSDIGPTISGTKIAGIARSIITSPRTSALPSTPTIRRTCLAMIRVRSAPQMKLLAAQYVLSPAN